MGSLEAYDGMSGLPILPGYGKDDGKHISRDASHKNHPIPNQKGTTKKPETQKIKFNRALAQFFQTG
jgi:hypothetical protein